MDQYCIYLRKSRADDDAEQRGEGETLARHEATLLALATKRQLTIGEIYREVVSGETLASRPAMQQLLTAVEKGLWHGVIVMEIERLARGNTLDQGIVANAFKYNDTLIVTPSKTYDPNNEFDEEYFEFGLFMSRREYKTINRRMQQGRRTSASEGKFCGSIPPFGYDRQKLSKEKGYMLVVNPVEAEIVTMIYEWYAYGDTQEDGTTVDIGRNTIAKRLNQLGIKNRRGGAWATSSVTRMLQNPTYAGKTIWDYRKTKKRTVEGKIITYRPVNNEPLIYDGLHPAIVSNELWQAVAHKVKEKRPSAVPAQKEMKNPMSGIVRCGDCGALMQRRPYQKSNQSSTLICMTHDCRNVSAPLYMVEARLLDTLSQWVTSHELLWKASKNTPVSAKRRALDVAMKNAEKEKENAQIQLNNIFDLLEQGVYSVELFTKRNQSLSEKITQAEKQHLSLLAQSDQLKSADLNHSFLIPKIQKLLDVYGTIPVREQNKLLREIIGRADYKKTVNGRWYNAPDTFELTVFPCISADF